jgi:hypothetical protein
VAELSLLAMHLRDLNRLPTPTLDSQGAGLHIQYARCIVTQIEELIDRISRPRPTCSTPSARCPRKSTGNEPIYSTL